VSSLSAKQSGVSLLEVLVAILVLSIGLLGLAGLQALALKNNQNSLYRTIATQQAFDMADRMRANFIGRQAGLYDAISGIPANPGCISTFCSTTNLATYDAFAWNTANAALLPSGAGTVSKSGNVYSITISWVERDTPGAPGVAADGTVTKSFVTRIIP